MRWPWTREKLNPAQETIVGDYGDTHQTSYTTITHQQAYDSLEIVNRGTNLVVDSCAEILIDVGASLGFSTIPEKLRAKKIETLLNFRPNPYINADVFKRNIVMDLMLEGNAFIYFDGAFLYNLPSINVTILSDKKTFIKGYKYQSVEYTADEVIHIRDNSGSSIYRGASRLKSAKKSINILNNMNKYQENFFKNSAVPGLVLKTPNVLSPKIKERTIREWQMKYNPTNGGRTPVILDGDFELDTLSNMTYKELDFAEGIKTQELKILKAIGVPPILLDSGNNANITPNYRLFYLSTVLPLMAKILSSFENFFGYDLKPNLHDIKALRPELKDEGSYLTALVNAGIMTRNEAREKIRLDEYTNGTMADELVIPANVAGSAVNPNTGGKPPAPKAK